MADAGKKELIYCDALTVFSFLWACQALVHQEFYNAWIVDENIAGWILTVIATCVLIMPRSRFLFCLMLTTSIVYNIGKWPFVVNHILVETVFNLVILFAFLVAWIEKSRDSERILARFVPVLKVSMITMYYFAILAKLNTGFFDIEQSCVVVMFDDLCHRFPFIPKVYWTKQMAIWGTIVIEFAIPILLTIKRTQWVAIIIGLAFHFMLGLVGHRTFSGLAYAVYGLFLLDHLTRQSNLGLAWLHAKWEANRLKLFWKVLSVVAIITVLGVTIAEYTGHYKSGIGPFKAFRLPWMIWISWSLCIAAVYVFTFYKSRTHSAGDSVPLAKPGWLWIFVGLVFLNGASQYLGLKTETCFTMYSNLRTEGGVNNHLFMPALRLANYQDDLVEILETDNQELHEKYVQKDLFITAFEFRRFLSTTDEEFFVEFAYDSKIQRIDLANRDATNHRFLEKHNLVLRKLLFFRPVPKSKLSPCQH